MTAKPTV
jgi:hypothetical protein